MIELNNCKINAKKLTKKHLKFELYPWDAQKNTENDEISVPFEFQIKTGKTFN